MKQLYESRYIYEKVCECLKKQHSVHCQHNENHIVIVVFISHSLTRKTEFISDICKRRNLLQENYNTGNRGAESQKGDGEVI